MSLAWLLAASSLFAAAAGAQPDPSRAFAAATEAFERGDYAAALADFTAARDAGMDDAAVAYNIAVCYYRLARYEQAEAEFRSIATRFPSLAPLARYNLGLALLRQDRPADARAAFERASAAGDDSVSGLARTALARLDSPATPEAPPAAPAPGQRLALIDIGVGHDGNVALVEDSSLLLGEPTGSALAEFLGLVSSPAPFDERLQLDASAYAVVYPDTGRFNQNALQLSAQYGWRFAGWRAEAGPQYAYSTLDGAGFEQRLGASFELARGLSPSVDLRLRLTHYAVDDLDARYDFIAGSRSRVRLSVDRAWEARRIDVGYEVERNDRDAAHVSPRRQAFSLGYGQALAGPWYARLEYLYRASRYEDLQVPREENLAELRASASRELASGWQLDVRYRRADNDSNAALYAYQRDRLVVGLSRVF